MSKLFDDLVQIKANVDVVVIDVCRRHVMIHTHTHTPASTHIIYVCLQFGCVTFRRLPVTFSPLSSEMEVVVSAW